MGVEHRAMQSPFFGLQLDVGCIVPASPANPAQGHDVKSQEVLRYAGDPVVRSGLPEPVGGRFGIIAKALLALAKCHLSSLAVLDVCRRPVPFDNVAQLIAQRLGAVQKPAIFTVEAPEPSFKLAS